MGRANYSDDCDDNWATICWRGAVKRAINGKRGQAFLREMLAAFNALPQPELIQDELQVSDQVCAIGAVGKSRGIDMSDIDPEDYNAIAAAFGISQALAREIMFENDEATFRVETPAQRFQRMTRWVEAHINPADSSRHNEGET